MTRVLIRFSHGLGDVVQLSVILKHLRKYRPDWQVDVVCGRGKHTALIGLCNRVYHDQEDAPVGPYDSTSDIAFFENYNSYGDRPNTKITNCLAETFGLEYDKSLGRYEMPQISVAREKAREYLKSIGCVEKEGKLNAVIIHYQGNTSTDKKNLFHWQARSICDLVLHAGRVPVVLDWDGRSSLPDGRTIHCPAVSNSDIWGGFGSGDAATITGLIQISEAFVGIDSGPGKCASCTATPALICWKALHPVQFHDPAPNTRHLIPRDWRNIPPCQTHRVAAFFEDNYIFETYQDEFDLIYRAGQWLSGVLGCNMPPTKTTEGFVLPNGIGDVAWALMKIRHFAEDPKEIDIILAGDPGKHIDQRAVPFLERFSFVKSVRVLDIPHLVDKENPTDSEGRYRYVANGKRGPFHFLMPNADLERGRTLTEWLEPVPTDWNVMEEFSWKNTEKGTEIGKALSPFVAFYLGPESGHSDEGHNRGWLWEPKHWVQLAKPLVARGMNIAVVGADYDRSFWERYVKEGVAQEGMHWFDFIGQMEIGETFAFLKESKFFISYQCGLMIVLHYLGGRCVSWWRPDGDSGHPNRKVCFDEKMATGWCNPALMENYIPCIYRREAPGDILAEIDRRGWLK